MGFPEPLDKYSRAKAFFRYIIGIFARATMISIRVKPRWRTGKQEDVCTRRRGGAEGTESTTAAHKLRIARTNDIVLRRAGRPPRLRVSACHNTASDGAVALDSRFRGNDDRGMGTSERNDIIP